MPAPHVVTGAFSATSVEPLWTSRMSFAAVTVGFAHAAACPANVGAAFTQATPLPSAPVSVVVSRTLPLRAQASSTSIGAATPLLPGVSVM